MTIISFYMKKITLSKGKIALVDDDDFAYLSRYKWYADNGNNGVFYAVHKPRRINISMHRLLMGDPKGKCVDHVDGNGLNNQKKNLRVCSYSQNAMHRRGAASHSKSGVLGVSWCKMKKRWRAVIQVEGRQKSLGYFDDIKEARRVRIEAEKKFYKSYSPIR